MFRSLFTRSSAASTLLRLQQRRGLACSTMYVKGIPSNFDNDKVRSLFEEFGNVYDSYIAPPRDQQMSTFAFVRFISGELPATVEETANLPPPSEEEIKEVDAAASKAIYALSGTTLEGCNVSVQYANKNMPDHVQFQARLQIRRERDPEWAARKSNDNYSARGNTADYTRGFKEGFQAGLKEHKNTE
ncbi:hypothetical protein H4R24_001645 [Coemansia sp. RSA 988]|nr:hypothetical protein H4R24_001645 [Coemansia sp. RSA 988]